MNAEVTHAHSHRHTAAQPRLPESTYRLQFHAGFTFRDATRIVPYLHDLGVTHCYASPYLKARPGSNHGYDVIDHSSFNPEVGTQADFESWVGAMRERGMSHILDTVPNHMGVGTNENAWWNNVLEKGRESEHARCFDIAWEASHRPDTRHKVLLPVLGAPYGEVLEKGELKLKCEGGRWAVHYYDRRFPVDPATAPQGDPASAVERYNGSPDLLDDLLRRQHYRLCYWRVASDEINYRRFFDINDLAALAMEREDVFHAVHRFTFELLRDGKVAGLRIDHPDGLFDPKQYFDRLQQKYARDVLDDESRAVGRPLYVVAEKILAVDEPLPEEWACHGTSGYDFLNMANGLFVDTRNADAFTRIYDEWIGGHTDFDDLVYRKKKLILEISLASELHMLARQLDRIAQSDRRAQDFTLNGLTHALREVIACFPVYRSYVTRGRVGEADVGRTDEAVGRAIARNPKTDPSAFRFVGDVVLLRPPWNDRDDVALFAGKFQQVTAPTTAKGIEDTAFYIYNRLVSLNEVGGEPAHFGVTPDALHAYLADRQKRWPYALSAMSTHDTKRSEDVRARINVLSEIPDEWHEHVLRWGALNEMHRRKVGGRLAPGRNEEYLIYQTLLGAWPLEPYGAEEYAAFLKRVQAYLEKAMREAKVHTSWTSPSADYESAVKEFVARLLDEKSGGEFLRDFRPFQKRVADLGLLNSLSQTLLKLAAPGVPDTYQGTELWDFSLVDPDNRRPVDYAKRQEMLRSLADGADPAELYRRKEDGRVKLYVTWRSLTARREYAGLFSEGEYLPAEITGAKRDNVFAFARRRGDRVAVVAVPRLVTGLDGDWGDTQIHLPVATRRLRNVFTGKPVAMAGGGALPAGELFGAFPLVLLVSAS
jgi:(1->4)-alpha-D-glucan 1-alpha-D-glucosylmutase